VRSGACPRALAVARALRHAAFALLWTAGLAQADPWRGPPAAPGSAASYRVFASAGGGIGEHALDCRDRLDCSRRSTAARGTLAVAVVPGLALEAVVLDFGRTEWQRPGLQLRERPRLTGLGLMAPLDLGPGLGAELRGGLGSAQTQRERITAQGNERSDRRSPQFYLGAALVLHLAPQAGLHWAVDTSLADLEQGTARVSATSLGLSLRF
jgi:hypothetical protein